MSKATPALEITTTEAPPPKPRKRGGKPVAIEEHTVVTKWAEEKKVGAVPPKARKPSPAEEFEEDEEPEETDLPDSAQIMFEEYGSDEGLMMDINRLPEYTLNRRTDPKAWSWVTMMPFTLQFKQEIALRHARPNEPNWFLIVLKDQNGRIISSDEGRSRIGPFAVEAATNDERIANGLPPHPSQPNLAAAINQIAPQPQRETMQLYDPPDPMAGINQTLNLLEKFQAIGLIPKLERGKPEPVVVQQNPQQQLSEEDIIIRAAMSSPDAQDRVAKGIFSKLIGGATAESDAPWYGDIIKDLLLGLTPGLNALMTVAAQNIGQAQAVVRQQQQNGVASLPQHVEQPEAIAPPQPEQPQAQEPDYDALLFGHILQLCKKRQFNTPDIAAQEIWDFIGQAEGLNGYNPFSRPLEIFVKFDAEILLRAAAEENPIAAKMAAEEDVLPWLKAVQDEIRKEWTNDGNEETLS